MEDMSRSVSDSRTQNLQLATTNAWPLANMENVPVSMSDLCSFEINCTAIASYVADSVVIASHNWVAITQFTPH